MHLESWLCATHALRQPHRSVVEERRMAISLGRQPAHLSRKVSARAPSAGQGGWQSVTNQTIRVSLQWRLVGWCFRRTPLAHSRYRPRAPLPTRIESCPSSQVSMAGLAPSKSNRFAGFCGYSTRPATRSAQSQGLVQAPLSARSKSRSRESELPGSAAKSTPR